MEATVFNPLQIHLLQMFALDKSQNGLKELKDVLYRHYSAKMEDRLDTLWQSGKLNQERLDEINEMDLHKLKEAMKIVLDTNSLIQSVPRQSRYHIVWESLVKGEHVLCVSNEILEEYLEILQRLTDYETAELIVKTIVNSPFVELITPYYHLILPRYHKE